MLVGKGRGKVCHAIKWQGKHRSLHLQVPVHLNYVQAECPVVLVGGSSVLPYLCPSSSWLHMMGASTTQSTSLNEGHVGGFPAGILTAQMLSELHKVRLGGC